MSETYPLFVVMVVRLTSLPTSPSVQPARGVPQNIASCDNCDICEQTKGLLRFESAWFHRVSPHD